MLLGRVAGACDRSDLQRRHRPQRRDPLVLTWLAVELPLLQRWLDTVSLTGSQWLAVVGLALLAQLLAIVEKAFRRSRTTAEPT
jgi:hypothetical protein